MSNKKKMALVGLLLFSIQTSTASAVGNGVNFVFREAFVPANAHPVAANSLDFTYHSCSDFTAMGQFTESGYLWISSFQDADSVVDSQINDYQANGYHVYARYNFDADQCSAQMTCAGQARRNYLVEQGAIALYVDPQADTVLALAGCVPVVVAGAADDRLLGVAGAVQNGQKSETNDLANGDFEIVFGDWVFTADGQDLFRDVNLNPLVAQTLVFNGNVTGLNGPLAADHNPEGSGNLFWRE